LTEGTRLSAGDLAPVEVRLPNDQLALYAGAERALEGAVLTRPVEQGELIPTEWVSEGAAGDSGRTLTVPVTPEHANGGRLQPGDRIDVLATFASGAAAACTLVLGQGLEVIDVVTAGGLVVEDEAAVGVTVAATPDVTSRLTLAIRTAEIDIARVTGDAEAVAPTRTCTEDLP
jgi:Flp pilus assembly protein CpaB